MSEKNSKSLAQTQVDIRPKIEDVIGDVLSGEKLKLALDFIAYLKENKLKLSWSSANTWSVKHKGNVILFIRLTGAEFFTLRENIENRSWLISPPFDIKCGYKEFQSDKQFNKTIWENVNYCIGCIKCKPGNTYKILGKEFVGVCHGAIKFVNPGPAEINCVKLLLEHGIAKSETHGTPKKPKLDPATNGLIRINNTDIVNVTSTEKVPCANLFNLKYAMFHSRSDCDIFFTTNEPVTLSMYGLVTYKESKLPNSWALYGSKNKDGPWEQLDTRVKTDVFPEPIIYHAEKALKIDAPASYQHYRLTLKRDSLYFLSQVHLYIQQP